MDALVDIRLTGTDTSPNTVESLVMDHEYGHDITEDSIPDNPDLPPNAHHQSFVIDGDSIKAYEGQSLIDSFKPDQEPSDIQNRIVHAHGCAHSQGKSDQVILPVISNAVLSSGCAVAPSGESPSFEIADLEDHIIVRSQEPRQLRTGTVSSAVTSREEPELGLDDRSTCTEVLYPEPDHIQSASAACPMDETQEDFDYLCEDLPSSPPPSSSPAQLLPSSPYASSQSSVSGVEPSKMVPSVEVEGHESSQDCPCGDHVVSIVQDESPLESKSFRNHDITDGATSPGTDKYRSRMDPISCTESSLGLSTKRIAYQSDPGELYESQPTKRPKLDPYLYLSPTPKRATLASQRRQFKKLATPFRPPLKLPAVTKLAGTTDDKEAESTLSTPAASQNKDLKRKPPYIISSQRKVVNTSRSVTQFKSPLVNRDLPPESRAIRLTPALQTLERKLQLLRRAIKVKEDKDEEVLTRLAGKWIEAGREIAYDVWDASKGAGDFGGKAGSIHRSFGWENNDHSKPWGWNIERGDGNKESYDFDPSLAPCNMGQLAPEDVGCNTLGTMLRQLGIAPEILGWDDDKEAFSD